ncbi:Hint domain-containing protein [Rhodalgimonas zhirmunskyi]|uniref:Hint domain-containing protein n=1 Tax=Rhodalgimonas zhirmunskyi TaxID=2964767 RepID=A0AAJ1X5E5_9RHOB|nr:Hint domain-containing protein [Rhodoalgimonas zhirmunskyi]MDQ2095168.1 Hint domain-containing protein [Rhodoalgimonas zhirmunskyi]
MNRPLTGITAATATVPEDSRIAPGFPGSLPILTLEGELPISQLMPGDRVITRDQGMAILRDITPMRTRCAMVRVRGGSLGHVTPGVDTLLPAAQPVLLRDWRAKALFGLPQAIAPAQALIDGEFICDAGEHEVALIQLSFDAPHILYVGGLELSCPGPEALRKAA